MPDLLPPSPVLTGPAFRSIQSMPLSQALATEFDAQTLVISLVTPGDTPPALQARGLRCVAWVPDPSAPGAVDLARLTHGLKHVASWVTMQAHRDLHLVVHCLLGISRSPAVADAVAAHFGMSCTHAQAVTRPDPTIRQWLATALPSVDTAQQFAAATRGPIQGSASPFARPSLFAR